MDFSILFRAFLTHISEQLDMRAHCNQFYYDICDALKGDNSFLGEEFVNLLNGELEELQDICSIIPEILELNDRGLIKATYEKGFQLFERMKPYFYTRYSWRGNGGFYYRIRQGDFRIKDGEDSKEKKMQLFHIKKTLRNRVGAYRYSVAGSPCLYLASDRELAWFECGMPKQFSYCQILIDEDNENGLVLVDFSFRPIDVLSSITCWLLGIEMIKESLENMDRMIRKSSLRREKWVIEKHSRKQLTTSLGDVIFDKTLF